MLKCSGYRLAGFVVLALMALSLTACPTPTPAPVPPATTATGGNFSVTVNPVGPPKWTYTVTTTGSSNISYIEIIAPININDCTVTIPNGWTRAGTVITSATGATSITYSIDCDKTNGPTYVKVNDLAGSGPNSLGPVAGPT